MSTRDDLTGLILAAGLFFAALQVGLLLAYALGGFSG